MTRPGGLALRVRLLGLVALAVMPAIALTITAGVAQRREAVRRGQDEAFRIARLISSDLSRLFEGTRQLLTTAAALPAVRERDGVACSRFFAELLHENPQYANLGAATTDGSVFCTGVPRTGVNIRDRSYFRRAIDQRSLAVGEFQIGRITGKRTLALAIPFGAPVGRVGGVVFAALDLAWLNALPLSEALSDGSAMAVVDRNGTVLLRQPDPEPFVGRTLPDAPIVRAALTRREGRVETKGLDGVERVYAFTELGGAGDASVTVGIPRTEVLATSNRLLRQNIIGLSIIGALALVAAWLVGNRFVVLPVSAAMESQREAARRERDSAVKLREADDMKNTFLAAVSHDLRNPVAVIRGFADLLANQAVDFKPEEIRDMLSRIASNALKLERLTNDLMDLNRLSRGTVEPLRRSTDLAALARRIVTEVDPQSHPVSVTGDEVVANVDPGQIERIIENLVRNAVKYTRGGLPIDVSLARVDGGALIAVDDRGPGVPDEIKTSVFEAFRRREGETSSGMGIGLYLVERFAALHGGRAWVEDRQGGGSSFKVYLPDER